MTLALKNPTKVKMPLNKETKPSPLPSHFHFTLVKSSRHLLPQLTDPSSQEIRENLIPSVRLSISYTESTELDTEHCQFVFFFLLQGFR